MLSYTCVLGLDPGGNLCWSVQILIMYVMDCRVVFTECLICWLCFVDEGEMRCWEGRGLFLR